MQLNGTFQGFDFAHLLQMLATSGKSGRLRLKSNESEGLVLLRNGKIICAVSTSVRESLGSILLGRGWLTPKQLEKGLSVQQGSGEDRRLGAILVDAGYVTQERLESAVAEQAAQVISEFLRWPTGSFEFNEARFPNRGEVEVATDRLPLDGGLAADRILLGITSAREDEPHTVSRPRVELPSLSEVIREFPAPLVTGEVAHKILDRAKGVVNRGALFQVGLEEFVGLSQFGMESLEDPSLDFIRDVRLSFRRDTVLRRAGATRTQYQGTLDPTAGNRFLLEALGGDWPTEVFVGPLFAGGRVMLIFYGDNLPECAPLGDTGALSTELLRSSSMLEHCLLSRIA